MIAIHIRLFTIVHSYFASAVNIHLVTATLFTWSSDSITVWLLTFYALMICLYHYYY